MPLLGFSGHPFRNSPPLPVIYVVPFPLFAIANHCTATLGFTLPNLYDSSRAVSPRNTGRHLQAQRFASVAS